MWSRCIMSAKRCALLVCICCVLHPIICESVGDFQTDWVPVSGSLFTNTSWPPHEDIKSKAASPRSFSENQLDQVDRAFDYSEFNEPRDELKAVPFLSNAQTVVSTGQAPLTFQTNVKGPGPAALTASSYLPQHHGVSFSAAQAQAPAQSYGPPSQAFHSGYYYPHPASQYLPPPVNLEVFENFSPNTFANQTSTTDLEVNTKNLLFVQAGKCSNSIEVGRVRDVEVKTAVKYGTEAQKGICVLMLYAANELNKLAVSLQSVQGTTNIVPMGNWLETNVKMYAVQGGAIMPISLNANFGPGSPALVLTKSNIVLLSFVIDRPVDFFVDISTYQSLTC